MTDTIIEPLRHLAGGGTESRPLIDPDLGWAGKYGYRTFSARVIPHGLPAEGDLRAARLAANVSHEAVAEALGVESAMVSGWETGRTPWPAHARARWLNICRRSPWDIETNSQKAAARLAAEFAAATAEPEVALTDILDALFARPGEAKNVSRRRAS